MWHFTVCIFLDGDGLLVNEDFAIVGSWCNHDGDTFLVGDTNGDHHDDWICHHRDGTVCTKYNSYIFGCECKSRANIKQKNISSNVSKTKFVICVHVFL